MRNSSYYAYFSFLFFWPLLEKNSRGHHTSHALLFLIVWGLQTQPKSWLSGWTFWANLYLEIMLSKFLSLNPLLKMSLIPYFGQRL